ncbi:2-methylcitrate dehydratase, partial [Bacillus cereus]
MAYIECKPVLKKVNLKPDGKKEIVLEVTDSSLQGKLDSLSEMIDA